MFALYLAVQSRKMAEENAMLSEVVKQLKAEQAINDAEISKLTERNATLEKIYQQRAAQQQKTEVKLREDISSLRESLAKNLCYQRPWPHDVVERLQQPY